MHVKVNGKKRKVVKDKDGAVRLRRNRIVRDLVDACRDDFPAAIRPACICLHKTRFSYEVSMNATGLRWLQGHNACAEAVEWAQTQPTLAVAWDKCERSDWLTWVLQQLPKRRQPSHRRWVRYALACTKRRAGKLTDERSKGALRVVARWLKGRTTDEEMRAASDSARAAAYSAGAVAYSAVAAADSAWAASDSAWAAAYSAEAVACSAWAVAESAEAAAEYAAAHADSAERKVQARVLRRIVANPWNMMSLKGRTHKERKSS